MARGDRHSDEMTLDMVSARAGGETVTSIAARHECTTQYVSTATTRVLRADCFESGEDPQAVRRCYW